MTATETSKQEVSDKKFAERLERQANDGHGWDKAPAMMREAADRIMRLIDSTAALDGYWSYECKQNERLRTALEEAIDWLKDTDTEGTRTRLARWRNVLRPTAAPESRDG